MQTTKSQLRFLAIFCTPSLPFDLLTHRDLAGSIQKRSLWSEHAGYIIRFTVLGSVNTETVPMWSEHAGYLIRFSVLGWVNTETVRMWSEHAGYIMQCSGRKTTR